MAAPPNQESPYYKDITHNLGYNPIVRAYTYLDSYLVTGWCKIPISYYQQEIVPGIGLAVVPKAITYEYLNSNTIRFYGEQGIELKVDLFIEPRKDAWYE